MTHGSNAHETAAYSVQTGRKPGDRLVYPGMGAVVSLMKGYGAGYTSLVPPYVVLTELQGRFSESGFLGPRHAPFATGGDPQQTPFAVQGVITPGVSEQRQRDRRALLHELDTLGPALEGQSSFDAFAQSEDQAYELILGESGKVFDLAQEKDETRERYGRNTFGQSCLAARRLVERGVPYVTVNFKGWDTHKQHFQIMRQKLPQLDKGPLDAAAGPVGTRAARQDDRLVLRRVRPHAEGAMGAAVERRPRSLGIGLLGARRRGRLPRRPRRGRLRCQRRGGARPAGVSRRPHRQHVRTPRPRSRGEAPKPRGARHPHHPAGRRTAGRRQAR